MFDMLIKGGRIIDGSGDPEFTGDVAIADGRIAEVGRVTGSARRTVAADGLLVTPGFVDIHTHYDGQATWDPLLSPSFHNGVTTVIFGNCGVGFAPARPHRRQWLLDLMEGVEEIPGTALHEGMKWEWESFPEYLDALAAKPRAIDVGALLAHGALRAYVMDDRIEADAPATEADIAEMVALVRQALDAGAFGFSTSRTRYHRGLDGNLVPGTFADEQELIAIGRALTEAGHGIMEAVPMGVGGEDPEAHLDEVDFLRRVAAESGCDLQLLVVQYPERPEIWRDILAQVDAARASGTRMTALVMARFAGVMFSFQSTNPFSRFPSYQSLAGLGKEERKRALRDPEVRARILADHDPNLDEWARLSNNPWPRTFILGDNNWEPDDSRSVESIARAQGREPKEVGYDMLLERDCEAFLLLPLAGYAGGDLEAVRAMLEHPGTVLSGSDAGAHCQTICDAATPTFMLSHWTRDRDRGPKIPLEWAVHKQTWETARAMNMTDRGLLRPGLLADLNVIDYDNLALCPPEYVRDLPGGAGRLMQRATGYVATVKAGEVISEKGEETGARPGNLVRSRRLS